MRLTPLFAVLFALFLAAPSSAAVPHVVQSGETLWSIAAANNLTTRTVAAFNGLSENSQVVLGSTIMVPSTVEGYAVAAEGGARVRARAPLPRRRRAAPPLRRAARRARSRSAATPCVPATRSPGSPRARACPSSAIAAMNGLDPNGLLIAGTVIKLPTGAPAPARAAQPAPAATVVPQAAPAPTSTRARRR